MTIPLLLLFGLSAVAVVPLAYASNSYTNTTLYIGGSTLIAPIMNDWTTNFHTYTGGAVTVSYDPVGSTTGTKDMLDDIFSAGWSDAPIPANGLATLGTGNVVTTSSASCDPTPGCPPVTGLEGNDPLVQIADGLATVAIFYNIPGITVDTHLNLTGDVIAEIYLGHITKWNDPRILALNPDLTSAQKTDLAAYPITVVHRSDGSGTSFALTSYFSVEDANWTLDGHTNSTAAANFPIGDGGDGSAGVTGTVLSTPGAIGYAEVSYPIGAGLSYAQVLNSAGYYVVPSPASGSAAAAADAARTAKDPTFTIVDASGAGSYPISTYTYVFIWANQDLGKSAGSTWTQGDAYDLVQFLNYIVTQGQSLATELNYSPLPTAVVSNDLSLLAQINYSGTPILTSPSISATCKEATATVGKTAVSCTATLTGATAPTGTISWSSSAAGTFTRATCNVSAKHLTCKSAFIAGAVTASESLTATYSGDLNNAPAIGSASLTVTQRTSSVTLICAPTSIVVGGSTTSTCTAVAIGYAPTGTITFSQSSTNGGAVTFSSATCTLTDISIRTGTSRCSVTATASTPGKVFVTATYGGDANNVGSTSRPKAVTVRS